MSAVVHSIYENVDLKEHLPGNVFNLILESDVLSHVKHLIMMAHENKSFTIKAYVGIENDNRMHWLEETFYDQSDVIKIADSLLNQHQVRHPYLEDDLTPLRMEIESFGLTDNPALSVLFPSV